MPLNKPFNQLEKSPEADFSLGLLRMSDNGWWKTRSCRDFDPSREHLPVKSMNSRAWSIKLGGGGFFIFLNLDIQIYLDTSNQQNLKLVGNDIQQAAPLS